MKITVKIEKEVDIRTVLIDIAIRYVGETDDDDMTPDFPLLNDALTRWVASVNIDTGEIAGWPTGEARTLSTKVTDQGTYRLFDADNNEVAAIVNDYVPNGVVPGSYGDYVELEIDANGIITNWPKRPDISEFFTREDD